MKWIAIAIPAVLTLQASVYLIWPHTFLRCSPGCGNGHNYVRVGNQGILYAAACSLLAAIAGALLL